MAERREIERYNNLPVHDMGWGNVSCKCPVHSVKPAEGTTIEELRAIALQHLATPRKTGEEVLADIRQTLEGL